MNPVLSKWSWGDITRVYASFTEQYQEVQRVSNACGIQKLEVNIDYSDLKNIFILRALRQVRKIEAHIAALDAEIARRNSLIGVIG